MSGGMPELGSKISLISKADIRYEGRLYTVDPQECTIALSSVRSFGTEDRETQFQIAPQSQIYDYILFRGSDIKDIRVVNNAMPHPNDPAIMQVQLPNGQHLMPHFQLPNLNPPHAPPMGTGAYGNPFGGMSGLSGMSGLTAAQPSVAASLAPGSSTTGPFMLGNQQQQHQQQQHQQQQKVQQQQQQQQHQQQQQKQPISVIDMLAGASRSTTPVSLSRKSPPADMGMQGNQQQHHQQQQNQNNAGHGGNARDAGHKRQNHQQRTGNPTNNQRNGNNNTNNHNDYYQQQQHQQHDRRDSGRNVDNYNNGQQQHYNDGRNSYNNNNSSNRDQQQQRNHQGGQNRGWTMQHRGPNNAPNNMIRSRGIPGGVGGGGIGGGGGGGLGGGRGRMPNQGYRPMDGNPNKPRNPKNTIKFEQDFDFEQANTKFEELRLQISKLKVGDEPKIEQLPTTTTTTTTTTTPTPPSQMNGEVDKKDDSGNETGAGEHEPEDEEITVGYDKTKSFFDNISCEAAQDRSKNKKNDWRQERKLNSETFGVSSTRRGSYRGRGGNYYNRNIGNYNGGGGYNRGYRGGNNYRNRSHNRMGRNGVPRLDTNNQNINASNDAASTLKNQTQQQQPNATAGVPAAAAATVIASSITKSTTQDTNATQSPLTAVAAGQ